MQQISTLQPSLSMLYTQARQAKVLQNLSSDVSWYEGILDSSCGQAAAAQQEALRNISCCKQCKRQCLAHSRHQCHAVKALQQPELHAIGIHSLLTHLCQDQW